MKRTYYEVQAFSLLSGNWVFWHRYENETKALSKMYEIATKGAREHSEVRVVKFISEPVGQIELPQVKMNQRGYDS